MMGNHVILDIVPDGIGEDDWAGVYGATLRLLQAHPSRLVGHDWMMVFGTRLAVYTRSIERYADTPAKRHWCVVGDRASLRMGEHQILYRDVRNYRLAGRVRLPPFEDILQYAVEETHTTSATASPQWLPSGAGGPTQVFGGDTRGEPYRLPLLAAAMLVESRLPFQAMVRGDITRADAEEAKRFAERVMGIPVALPVRLDALRLADRLRRFLLPEAIAPALERLCLDRPRHDVSTSRQRTPSRGTVAEQDGAHLAVARSLRDLSATQRDDLVALALAVGRARDLHRDVRQSLLRSSGGDNAPRSRVDQGLAAVLGSGDAMTLRRALAQILADRGPTLTEDAWDRISREDDLATLQLLLVLAAMPGGSNDFFRLQRAVLENGVLARHAVDVLAHLGS